MVPPPLPREITFTCTGKEGGAVASHLPPPPPPSTPTPTSPPPPPPPHPSSPTVSLSSALSSPHMPTPQFPSFRHRARLSAFSRVPAIRLVDTATRCGQCRHSSHFALRAVGAPVRFVVPPREGVLRFDERFAGSASSNDDSSLSPTNECTTSMSHYIVGVLSTLSPPPPSILPPSVRPTSEGAPSL